MILAAALALLAGIVMFFAQVEDRSAAAATRASVKLALEGQRQQLAREARDIAWRNDTVRNLVEQFDASWATEQIGLARSTTDGLSASFVLDGADKTVVAFLDGQPSNLDGMAALPEGLAELLQATRSSPPASPEPAAGMLTLAGVPQIVATCAITPQGSAPAWPPDRPRFVLVLARPLDTAFFERMGREFQLNGLRLLSPGERRAEATLPLVSPSGSTLATLGWMPERPSLRLILGIEPVIAGVAAVIIGLFWWFLRRAQRLSDTLSQQATIIDQIHDAVIVVDPQGRITRWNAGAERMLGHPAVETLGRDVALFDDEGRFRTLALEMLQTRNGEQHGEIEILARRKSGELFPAHISLSRLNDGQDAVTGVAGYLLDITERKKLEARLEQLAIVDELTRVYNRRHLMAEAPAEIRRALRFQRALSFLFLDLDHFKAVNDRFGHPFGDRVLAVFADTCRRILRPSDLFARYGGEEFLVMLPETGLEQAEVVARRIGETVGRTVFSVDPPLSGLTVSIGITSLRGAGDGLEAVLARIDKAAYRAKELGRNRIEVMT